MNKTLKIDAIKNFLLHYAVEHSPVEGMRLSDLDMADELKKLFVRPAFEGEVDVEVDAKYLRLLRVAWAELPVGRLARTDALVAACRDLTSQIKD